MNQLEDRLSRISALRPTKRQGHVLPPGNRSRPSRDGLVRLLDATIQENELGGHMFVRRGFDEPHAGKIAPQAMDLLMPDNPESACDPQRWLFLDTETTGLAGGTGTYAFLVGIGWWEAGRFIVEQYFMRDHSEESSLLYGLLDRLKQRPFLVTYNGKSFDWPLLQTRYRMNRVAKVPEPSAHLDLLYPARRIWRLRLKSVALTQLETQVLRFNRGRDIPSGIIPQLYFDFLQGASPEGIAEVFHHNQMDLCGLAFLAQHILRILEDPENSGCGPTELFGISRLLQQRGIEDRAEHIYRLAVDGGLPESEKQIACRELALAAKRRRDFRLSNAYWEKLLGNTTEGYRAYEQLAIYYEHHEKLPERAALLSREALARLQEAHRAGRIPSSQYMRLYARFRHRRARLSKKISDL